MDVINNTRVSKLYTHEFICLMLEYARNMDIASIYSLTLAIAEQAYDYGHTTGQDDLKEKMGIDTQSLFVSYDKREKFDTLGYIYEDGEYGWDEMSIEEKKDQLNIMAHQDLKYIIRDYYTEDEIDDIFTYGVNPESDFISNDDLRELITRRIKVKDAPFKLNEWIEEED